MRSRLCTTKAGGDQANEKRLIQRGATRSNPILVERTRTESKRQRWEEVIAIRLFKLYIIMFVSS